MLTVVLSRIPVFFLKDSMFDNCGNLFSDLYFDDVEKFKKMSIFFRLFYSHSYLCVGLAHIVFFASVTRNSICSVVFIVNNAR